MSKFEPKFLSKPVGVGEWIGDENYRNYKRLIIRFSLVNDAAERAVKFVSDGAITRNPKRLADILHGIEGHNRAHPEATRASHR